MSLFSLGRFKIELQRKARSSLVEPEVYQVEVSQIQEVPFFIDTRGKNTWNCTSLLFKTFDSLHVLALETIISVTF